MQEKVFKIRFYGGLQRFCKNEMRVSANTVKDAFQGLVARFGNEFRDEILNGAWHITAGNRETEELSEKDKFLSEQVIEMPIAEEELHIFPAVCGAGGKGIGQIILGVVLIVVAVVIAWYAAPAILASEGAVAYGATVASGFAASSIATSLALAGVMAIAGGLLSMMTKTPSLSDYGSAAGTDPRNSFIFNGPVNNVEQGVPVPLVYGLHLTGSTVISAGLDSERI